MVAPRANPLGLALSRAAAPQSIAPPQGPSARALAAQRDFLANQLQNSMQDDPRDVGEGLTGLANTALAGYLGYRNDQKTEQATTQANQALVNALQGGKANIGDVIGPATSDFANPGLAQFALEQAGKGPEKDPLVEVVGKDGVKHLIPTSQAAGMQSDYAPKPDVFKPDITTIPNGNSESAGYLDQNGKWIQLGSGPRFHDAPRTPKLITLTGPDNKPMSLYDNDPRIPSLLQGGYVEGSAGGESTATSTLYGPDGTVKTVLKSSPDFKTMIANGWVERSPADPNSKPATEDQARTAQLYQEIIPEAPILMKNFDALGNMSDRLADAAPDVVSAYFQSPEYQEARDALAHVITNNLYSLSGATIGDKEAQRRASLLMPRPGEAAQSKKNKKQRIKDLFAGMKTRAGKAADKFEEPDFGDVDTLNQKYGVPH